MLLNWTLILWELRHKIIEGQGINLALQLILTLPKPCKGKELTEINIKSVTN